MSLAVYSTHETAAKPSTPVFSNSLHGLPMPAAASAHAPAASKSVSSRVKTSSPSITTHFTTTASAADKPPKPKRQKTSQVEPPDPSAASFLRDTLGAQKFAVLSARLFEQRFSAATKAGRASSQDETEQRQRDEMPASILDFLVKVEIVKEALRKYVPHPYDPVKSQTHVYAVAPSGSVTLTRTTILSLAGWSNTQFAYWARRSEGVSVLRKFDDTLAAVASALDHRLNGTPAPSFDVLVQVESITGKSLDRRITDVSKTMNVSPFLKGRHCSLDPFGAGGMGVVSDTATLHPAPASIARHRLSSPPPVPTLPPPPMLFSLSNGSLVSKLSYSVSDSRSSGKRSRACLRGSDDTSGTSSDEDDEIPMQKRARLYSTNPTLV